MIEAIVKAASIPVFTVPPDPFTQQIARKHILIVGGTHLIALQDLFPKYALEATILIPQTIPELDRDLEIERAALFEVCHEKYCRGVGVSRDLSGIDSDSVDYLVICTPYPQVRDEMLSHAWRVVKEFGKVLVFSSSEIPPTILGHYGIANPIYYAVEGFYIGTMRKAAAIRARN